jgi:hypothetical protein
MLARKDRGPSTRAALAQDDRKSQNRSQNRSAQDDGRGGLLTLRCCKNSQTLSAGCWSRRTWRGLPRVIYFKIWRSFGKIWRSFGKTIASEVHPMTCNHFDLTRGGPRQVLRLRSQTRFAQDDSAASFVRHDGAWPVLKIFANPFVTQDISGSPHAASARSRPRTRKSCPTAVPPARSH